MSENVTYFLTVFLEFLDLLVCLRLALSTPETTAPVYLVFGRLLLHGGTAMECLSASILWETSLSICTTLTLNTGVQRLVLELTVINGVTTPAVFAWHIPDCMYLSAFVKCLLETAY